MLLESTNKIQQSEQKVDEVDSDNIKDLDMPYQKKVGGWQSLLTDTIVGVARKQHAFVDTDGNEICSHWHR